MAGALAGPRPPSACRQLRRAARGRHAARSNRASSPSAPTSRGSSSRWSSSARWAGSSSPSACCSRSASATRRSMPRLTTAPFALGGFVGSAMGGMLMHKVGRTILQAGLVVHGRRPARALRASAPRRRRRSAAGTSSAPMLVAGIGMGMVWVPLFEIVIGDVADHEVGSASGVLQAMQQFGMSLGVAAHRHAALRRARRTCRSHQRLRRGGAARRPRHRRAHRPRRSGRVPAPAQRAAQEAPGWGAEPAVA